MSDAFDPAGYWEQRLSDSCTLGSVGWVSLGESFNRWMYAVRRHVFKRMVHDCIRELSNARVLDVGSGTGFYLRLWRELGVTELSGSDLTSVAVAHLRESFPGKTIHQIDIGGDPEALPVGEYDAVSIIDVLYHIVDDERYMQAMRNLSRLMRPGGVVIFSENFLDRTIAGTHQVSRSSTEIQRALAQAQLEPIVRRPMFFLMNTPVDSESRLLHAWWSRAMEVCHRGERAGWLLGAATYPLELALVRMASRGPSSKIMACRKRT